MIQKQIRVLPHFQWKCQCADRREGTLLDLRYRCHMQDEVLYNRPEEQMRERGLENEREREREREDEVVRERE